MKIDIDRGEALLSRYYQNDKYAEIIVKRMIKDKKVLELDFLEEIGITGTLLSRLFNLCYSDYLNFYRTICVLKSGIYDNQVIYDNLCSTNPIPFVYAGFKLSTYHINQYSDNIESDLKDKFIKDNYEKMFPLIENNIIKVK